MRKALFLLLLATVAGFPLIAHPLDVSMTTFQWNGWSLRGTLYIHPYELGLLAKDNGLTLEEENMPRIREIVTDYFLAHYQLSGPDGAVYRDQFRIQRSTVNEILSDGMYINFVYVPEDNIPITFHIDLFLEYFSTQTNKLIFLNARGEPLEGSEEVILTKRKRSWTWNPVDPDFTAFLTGGQDSDGDGLTDRMESLYGMDPDNPDTDGDGYTDAEEFAMGWDPFDPEPSPGQSREFLESRRTGNTDSTETVGQIRPKPVRPGDKPIKEAEAEPENLIKKHNVKDRRITGSPFLRKTLDRMQSALTGPLSGSAVILLLGMILILGFLHAAMPGHSKGLMIAYLSGGERKLLHAFLFILIFTFTHLVDVVILGLAFSLLNSMLDSARISTLLQMGGGIGVLIIGVWMTLSGLYKAAFPGEEKEERPIRSLRDALVIGFLAGLQPCPFGLYLLWGLQSMNKLNWVPLVILVFGIGIFLFLILFALSLLLVKRAASPLLSRFGRYVPLASGILMLIFALALVLPGLNTLLS